MRINRRNARPWIAITAVMAAWITYTGYSPSATAQAAGSGTIKGEVKLTGPAPVNPMIRMGMDPPCSRENAGKRLNQEIVLKGADGGLANAFVQIDGALPASAPPADPVVINQKGCVYSPRVVGAQAGQTLRVINSDTLPHNVHIANSKINSFDTTQPKSGMVFNYTLKKDDTMLRLGCMIHSWMTAYIGVSPHPFFAVTDKTGTFTIAKVPPGKYTIHVWHERFGRLTRTVDVTSGGTATINFDYTGSEKPQAANEIHQLLPTS
jgi:plastocyanin